MGPWVFLSVAILFEIIATAMLKASDGFEKPMWGVGSMLCYGLCFLFFAPALKLIPVGVAYAIWSGLGIVAISVVGVLVFGDKLNLYQIVFLSLIIIGAVGLRVTTTAAG